MHQSCREVCGVAAFHDNDLVITLVSINVCIEIMKGQVGGERAGARERPILIQRLARIENGLNRVIRRHGKIAAAYGVPKIERCVASYMTGNGSHANWKSKARGHGGFL